MKIYIDVLVITNAAVTLMFILGLGKITHTALKKLRIAVSCIFGGLSSLLVIAEPQGFFQSLIVSSVKIICIIITILIAFKWRGLLSLVKYFLLYLTMNLLFAGCCFLLWEITGSRIIYIKNYTVYFDISLISIAVSTILAYAAITVYDIITTRCFRKDKAYKAKYTVGDYEITLPAVADTGNTLCDSFTGIPVIVFYCDELFEHFNLDYENYCTVNGFRLIPYSTINGSSLISVTSRGKVEILSEDNFSKEVRCYVGIVKSADNKSRAIFNPNLLV